mgnify:CR=1 FL=1
MIYISFKYCCPLISLKNVLWIIANKLKCFKRFRQLPFPIISHALDIQSLSNCCITSQFFVCNFWQIFTICSFSAAAPVRRASEHRRPVNESSSKQTPPDRPCEDFGGRYAVLHAYRQTLWVVLTGWVRR